MPDEEDLLYEVESRICRLLGLAEADVPAPVWKALMEDKTLQSFLERKSDKHKAAFLALLAYGGLLATRAGRVRKQRREFEKPKAQAARKEVAGFVLAEAVSQYLHRNLKSEDVSGGFIRTPPEFDLRWHFTRILTPDFDWDLALSHWNELFPSKAKPSAEALKKTYRRFITESEPDDGVRNLLLGLFKSNRTEPRTTEKQWEKARERARLVARVELAKETAVKQGHADNDWSLLARLVNAEWSTDWSSDRLRGAYAKAQTHCPCPPLTRFFARLDEAHRMSMNREEFERRMDDLLADRPASRDLAAIGDWYLNELKDTARD